MNFPPIKKTFEGMLENFNQRLTSVERRLAKGAGGSGGTGTVGTGPSSARDAQWGVPANTAEQVELHNKKTYWLNTDNGWMESYYTVNSTGVIGPYLSTGTAPGWYPVAGGGGPVAQVIGNGSIAVAAANTRYDLWEPFGSTSNNRNTTLIDFNAHPGVLATQMPGRYNAFVRMPFSATTTVGQVSFGVVSSANSVVLGLSKGHAGLSGWTTVVEAAILARRLSVGQGVYFISSTAGPWTMGGTTSCQLSLQYIGPDLVSL
jgi:hypothetical protein